MHSVHLPDATENGYFGAVMGLIFDSKKYDPTITQEEVDIIDSFFDSLQLDQLDVDTTGTPKSEVALTKVAYGQLMNIAQTDNRFIYTGSLTTPPCTEKVFWNVINRVYPIKERHLSTFRYLIAQQMRQEADPAKYKITSEGNYRNVQKIKKQNPVLMVRDPEGDDPESAKRTNHILTIVLVVVVVKVVIVSGLIFMILNQRDEFRDKKRQAQLVKSQKTFDEEDGSMF